MQPIIAIKRPKYGTSGYLLLVWHIFSKTLPDGSNNSLTSRFTAIKSGRMGRDVPEILKILLLNE